MHFQTSRSKEADIHSKPLYSEERERDREREREREEEEDR